MTKFHLTLTWRTVTTKGWAILLFLVVAAIATVTLSVRQFPVSRPNPSEQGHHPVSEVGSLSERVDDFAAQIPGQGSGGYYPPTHAQRSAFSRGVRAATASHLELARDRLAPLDYTVTALRDETTSRELVILEEVSLPDGSRQHGWGLYVINPAAGNSLLIEVPHPLYDVNTPAIGVALFEAADAQALLVAGTHRYANSDGSSDVAHADGSIFEAVDHELVTPGSIVVQAHGFDESDHGVEGDVVVSGGVTPTPPLVARLGARLTAQGIATCVYGDGQSCDDLGGTDNLQGHWAVARGATFVQVEMSRAIRDDAGCWQTVVAALAFVLT